MISEETAALGTMSYIQRGQPNLVSLINKVRGKMTHATAGYPVHAKEGWVLFPNFTDRCQFKTETVEVSQASQIILDNCVGSLVLNTIGMTNS